MDKAPAGTVGQHRGGDVAELIEDPLNGPAQRIDRPDQFTVDGVFEFGPPAVRGDERRRPPR